MRIFLAIGSFIVAALLLGFFGFCSFQAISDLGLVLAAHEIIGSWENSAVLGGCLLFGAGFLITGVAVSVSALIRHGRSA
jgi:hypothetical protein